MACAKFLYNGSNTDYKSSISVKHSQIMAVPVAICDLRWKFEGVNGSDTGTMLCKCCFNTLFIA